MKTVAVGEICELKYGSSLPERSRKNGNVPVYGSNGQVGFHSEALTNGPAIIVGRKGSIGQINYSALPCWPIDTTYFVDQSATKHDLKWLSYALSSLRLDELNKATGVPGLNRNDAYAKVLYVPLLDEQRRIAGILDQADDLRRRRKEALGLLKSFPSAVMEELLGDGNAINVKRLDELIQRDDRINYGVVQPGPEVEEGIPLVRVENVVDEDFSRSSLKHISPQIEAQYSRSRLHGDEVLVACVGSIGAVALVRPDQRGFNIARAVARIPVDPMKAERIFVAEYLKRPETQAYFKSETRAVAQPTLNIKQLCETRLRVPPLSVQHIFAARVAEVDKLKAHHRAHLAKLDALFASLRHRAFRGEL